MKLRRTGYGRKERRKLGRKRRRAISGNVVEGVRVVRVPPYGDVPLIRRTARNMAGEEFSYWVYDPDFKPELPPGAIRGDVRRQVFCPMCWNPKYYYRDVRKTCVQCGEDFTFSAGEQKYWYETRKAVGCYGRFLESAASRRGLRVTVKTARRRLKALAEQQQ